MLPRLELFGFTINMYKLFFFLALVTVPIVLFSIRKSFGYSVKQSLFYSIFTLAFGYLSAMITAAIENNVLSAVSNHMFLNFEFVRNYGIPMFLPLFLLFYCILFRDSFRTLSDYIAPCVYSVMTFVKIGCVFWGCCYSYPDDNGIMNQKLGYKTFPVQLYDSISSLIIVIICLLLVLVFLKMHRGYVYPIGGMLFAITKGYWENYRVHSNVWEKNFLDTGWTFWQFWMLILFVGCFVWLIIALVWEKRNISDFNERPPIIKRFSGK